jgi:hypothetical protein
VKINIKAETVGVPAAFLYRSWIRSLRFEEEGFDQIMELPAQGKRVMVAIWHNELFSLTGYGMKRKVPIVTMASDSKDGQYITEVLERIGYKVARGSSTRGGVKAMMNMVRIMKKENRVAVITVDGPKGPRHKFKHGILAIAKKTGAVILPARAVHDSAFVFKKSWDNFEVPKPFSHVKIKIGQPYMVQSEKQDEAGFLAEAEILEKKLEELAD